MIPDLLPSRTEKASRRSAKREAMQLSRATSSLWEATIKEPSSWIKTVASAPSKQFKGSSF